MCKLSCVSLTRRRRETTKDCEFGRTFTSHQNAHTHLVHKSFFCPPLFLFLSFIPSFLYFRLYRLELVQYKKNKTPSSTIIYFLSSPPLLSFTLKNHHPLTFNNPYQPRSHRFFISQPLNFLLFTHRPPIL